GQLARAFGSGMTFRDTVETPCSGSVGAIRKLWRFCTVATSAVLLYGKQRDVMTSPSIRGIFDAHTVLDPHRDRRIAVCRTGRGPDLRSALSGLHARLY